MQCKLIIYFYLATVIVVKIDVTIVRLFSTMGVGNTVAGSFGQLKSYWRSKRLHVGIISLPGTTLSKGNGGVMCNGAAETCPYVTMVWNFFLGWMRAVVIQGTFSYRAQHHVPRGIGYLAFGHSSHMLGIWRERNHGIFRWISHAPSQLISRILVDVYFWTDLLLEDARSRATTFFPNLQGSDAASDGGGHNDDLAMHAPDSEEWLTPLFSKPTSTYVLVHSFTTAYVSHFLRVVPVRGETFCILAVFFHLLLFCLFH